MSSGRARGNDATPSSGWAALLGAVLATVVALLGVPAMASAADACPNAEFRVGPSANLPDCRAYELVSPGYTAGIRPTSGSYIDHLNGFAESLISMDANSVLFNTVGGALPGFAGTGYADRYRATRGPGGWHTQAVGPTAAESEAPSFGGANATHDYLFFQAGYSSSVDLGSLVLPGDGTNYLRLPDGSLELVGLGSVGTDPEAIGRYISPNAEHVIFSTSSGIPLEPGAAGFAVYDRTPGGPTQLVSRLPDGSPALPTFFRGASADGSAVAFDTAPSGSLYVRVNNTETHEVITGSHNFAGLSVDGSWLFYANSTPGGVTQTQAPADLFAFDVATQQTKQITSTGDARFVNVSTDGSHVYFESPSQIGGQGTGGQPNLYVWDRDADSTTLVATLEPADVPVAPRYAGRYAPPTLVGWTQHAMHNGDDAAAPYWGPGANLSRTTPDGSVLVFESVSQLTPYDNDGHQQVYRYDATQDELSCLSCLGAGPATGHATLQNVYSVEVDTYNTLAGWHATGNLVDDGETVVFQSEDPLVPQDGNGKQDVYRWRGGELALITTGQSSQDSFLYTVDDDASDVVVLTAQKLTPDFANGGTAALYDARVGGGFPAAAASGPKPCTDDACQGPASVPPPASAPASTGVTSGSPARPRSCARQRVGVRRAKLRRTRVMRQTRGTLRRPASRRARRVANKRLRRARAQLQQCRRSVR